MKLIKHTPIKTEDHENNFISSEEMVSDDPGKLKSKANELCRSMGVEPTGWASRYPIMGRVSVESNTEWVMALKSGIIFSIENKIR